MHRTVTVAVAAGLTLALAPVAHAGQPLETESTRLLPAHRFEVKTGFEHQHSSGGTESAAPLAFGYGVTDRLELLVEPVPFNLIRDHSASKVQGPGDLEVTLTSRVFNESVSRPAFAIAGAVKLPTATNRRIGSGKTDVTGWAIVSRRIGRWDTHANCGYSVIGKPAGIAVNNFFNYALGEELHVGKQWEVVGEVFGNTDALAETADSPKSAGESATTPEIGGAETVGMHGMPYVFGVSVDSQSAVLVHPGFTFAF